MMQARATTDAPAEDPFTATPRRPSSFSALRHRNFRLFWSGQMISLIGTWLQNTAQQWLVLGLATTEFGKASAAYYVGLVSMIGTLPISLLCLFAGVFSDRLDRRRILIATQVALMLLAFGLGLLAGGGVIHLGPFALALPAIRLWHVAIFSMLSGVTMAFDMPTRQAFVKDMTSPEDMHNAIALNSIIFNLARIFGPAVAGYLIQIHSIGVPGALYINAASYLAVILGILLIRIPAKPKSVTEYKFWEHLREGFSFAVHHRVIRVLLMLIAVYSIFGFSYGILLPVVAKQTFGLGPAGFGHMLMATGIGATAGAFLLTAATGRIRKGRVLFWGSALATVGIFGFGVSHNFYLSLAMLPFIGAGLVVGSATINSLIQEHAPDYIRGRVVSIWAFCFAGSAPIGAYFAGAMASITSTGTTIMISGVICLLTTLLITARARWIWRLE